MKTLVKIENDYLTSHAYDEWKEDINYLASELDILCTIRNRDYSSIEVQNTKEKDDYSEVIIIEAKGYSQGEWQDYVIYYDKWSDTLSNLCEELKKTFTHKHNYFVSKHDIIELDGKKYTGEAYDHTGFIICDVEFPNENKIIETYIEYWGKDYDIIEFNI